MNPLRAPYTPGTRIGTRVLVAGPESRGGKAHYLAACDCGRPATWVPAAQLLRGMRQTCRWCGQQARRQASQRDVSLPHSHHDAA